MSDNELPDFDTMTPADFEKYLPDLFATGDGRVSTDPRLENFLKKNPDCAALVRDLETIAEYAKSLFEPVEPSDAVWSGIQDKLKHGGEIDDDDLPLAPSTQSI